jgi:DNA-binding MarR family transcriptional regulator
MDEIEPSPRTLRAATAVRRATGLLARRMRRQGGDPAMSAGRASMLGHLARAAGPLTPGELAAADGLQPQSVTRLLADLEGRGWISRTPDARDGRQARIAITAAGSDALAREAAARDLWLARAMTLQLSPAERSLLRAAADLVSRLCETPAPLTADELPSSAVPILPTHDGRRTRECLVPLGFEVLPGSDDGYLMLRRDGLELHYQHADDVDPFRTAASAFAWVADVDAFHARVLSSAAVGAGVLAVVAAPAAGDGRDDESALRARWAAEGSVARIGPPEDKPWRVRELALFDPTNNLLRIGHPIGLNRELTRRRRARA